MHSSLRILSVYVLGLGIVTAVPAEKLSSSLESEHGTCAIALATNENMALIVDSRLTRAGSMQSCTERHPEGCKAILVRKDILLAVTGIFNDPVGGINWKVGDETKRLLLKLPKQLETKDLDTFLVAWFDVLVAHFDKKVNLGLDKGREVSTLLIATRIHGVPYIYKASIYLNTEGLFRYEGRYLIVDEYPQLFYAGSCHDNINSHPLGGYVPAPDPPNTLYKWELEEIGQRKMTSRTVSEFVPILSDYEKLFEKIGESKNKCWIGPPYDVATWAKGGTSWTTNFKVKCRSTLPAN
jgi:hypothetical protein